MTDLGTLGRNFSIGYGINNAGQITGEVATASGAVHAFLYAPALRKHDPESRIQPVVAGCPAASGTPAWSVP
jgi:probable HAF family extracellular repeat protein